MAATKNCLDSELGKYWNIGKSDVRIYNLIIASLDQSILCNIWLMLSCIYNMRI